MPGAVWYATGYLHSLYTAAEHSILAFFGGFCGDFWGVLPSVDRGIETAGAVWYATGYLHSLYTAAEHSVLAFWGVFALRGPRHQNGSLSRPVGMGPAPAD